MSNAPITNEDKAVKRVTLAVKPEGRPDMWIPEKESLIVFVKSRNLEQIHNFIPSGMMMIGADHSVESVLEDIERSSRAAVFTNPSHNMGHSLALIFGNADNGDNEKLECYDIGRITVDQLSVTRSTTESAGNVKTTGV